MILGRLPAAAVTPVMLQVGGTWANESSQRRVGRRCCLQKVTASIPASHASCTHTGAWAVGWNGDVGSACWLQGCTLYRLHCILHCGLHAAWKETTDYLEN